MVHGKEAKSVFRRSRGGKVKFQDRCAYGRCGGILDGNKLRIHTRVVDESRTLGSWSMMKRSNCWLGILLHSEAVAVSERFLTTCTMYVIASADGVVYRTYMCLITGDGTRAQHCAASLGDQD